MGRGARAFSNRVADNGTRHPPTIGASPLPRSSPALSCRCSEAARCWSALAGGGALAQTRIGNATAVVPTVTDSSGPIVVGSSVFFTALDSEAPAEAEFSCTTTLEGKRCFDPTFRTFA